ncbi:MAG TPA: pyridoxamine 5'-phosphate oxidase family protein [Arthrobacter sp.]|nr:pyridoxamine 5'-phosphate oxidase family protein [Arthrobacter sp.]
MANNEIPPVEHLPAEVCWELLRSSVVGRLAVVIEDHPDIFPLNYVVDGGSVVFRTAAGTKMAGALANTPVALEVDGYDVASEQAWSVVLRGRAEHILQPRGLAAASSLPLFPWQQGPKEHFVRIHLINMTGRRFTVAKPDIWTAPVTDKRRESFE